MDFGNDLVEDPKGDEDAKKLGQALRVEPMKIDFRIEISVLQQFDSKFFFKIPREKIKVLNPDFQTGRFLEILCFLTILDFAHV